MGVKFRKRKIIDLQKLIKILKAKQFYVNYKTQIKGITIESLCLDIFDCIIDSSFRVIHSKKDIKNMLKKLKNFALEGI